MQDSVSKHPGAIHPASAGGQTSASKYLTVETFSSAVSNALLNLAAAFAIFHGRSIPTIGAGSLLADSIGETVFVVFLSTLIPTLIARSRRRAGSLPVLGSAPLQPPGNLYVRSTLVAVVFTAIGFGINFLLLPRLLPGRASYTDILVFKTVYGTIFGALATYLALRKALREGPTRTGGL